MAFQWFFFSLAIDKVLQKLNKAKRNFRKKSNKNIRPWSNFSRISRNIARAWNKIWIKKSRRTIQNRKFSRFCWRLRSWHHGRRGHDRHALTNQSLAMTSRADFVWPLLTRRRIIWLFERHLYLSWCWTSIWNDKFTN